MIIRDVTYEELEEEIERFCESEEMEDCVTEYLIQNEHIGSDDAIIVFDPAWRITDKGIIVMEGVYLSFDRMTRELTPDWSLTCIYDDVPEHQFDPEKYVYFEQDPPATAVHNYLCAIDETGCMTN